MFLTANCHVYYIFRYGFSTEKDYNDSESYCGGWARQHQRNGGKCGVCGDAWDLPQVSSHTSSRERFFPLPSLFFLRSKSLNTSTLSVPQVSHILPPLPLFPSIVLFGLCFTLSKMIILLVRHNGIESAKILFLASIAVRNQ